MNASADYPFGFVVAGPASGTRVLCRWMKTYTEALEGDGTPEGYLSLWSYGRDFVEYVQRTGSTAGYPGPVWAPWVSIDIDGPGASTEQAVGAALAETKQLLCWLETEATANLGRVQLHFSGGKGFHLGLPLSGVADGPVPDFHRVVKAYVGLLAAAADVRHVDGAIYDKARIFRLPNSRHPRTGLYKIPLPAGEVLELSPARVLALARAPRPGEAPDLDAGTWCDWTLAGLWSRARAQVERGTASVVPAASKDRLNPSTLDFIRHGADQGQRAVDLFKASANLAELGAPLRLCRALLREMALDTGLPVEEVDTQLEKGHAHGSGRAAA